MINSPTEAKRDNNNDSTPNTYNPSTLHRSIYKSVIPDEYTDDIDVDDRSLAESVDMCDALIDVSSLDATLYDIGDDQDHGD